MITDETGFWYVTTKAMKTHYFDEELQEEVELPEPEYSPEVKPSNQGYCAWYGEIDGVVYVVIRTAKPIEGIEAIPNVSVEAVLQVAGQKIKPSVKVQGR